MTFSADQIAWVDFEARAPDVDLKADGTLRYAAEATTSAIVLAYALGGAPALAWHADGAILVSRIETNPALAFMPIRMTTHDEIVCEVEEARTAEAKALLRREMLTLPDWAQGLPLQSEESTCRYYTKAKAALNGDKP
jgi:hypothetical protein